MQDPGSERKLAAILSGDVVGYSRLMAADESAAVRLVTQYREEVELLVHQHRGRLVDFTGDNFLVEFSSVVPAVQCALQIQAVIKARNAHLPEPERMGFRLGLHQGDVRVEGERIFGTGVNVAARLEALAEPGGICISGAVRDELRNKLELPLDDLGPQALKNIPDPVHVYSVRAEPEVAPQVRREPRQRTLAVASVGLLLILAAAGWWLSREVPPAPLEPVDSIAVLPFENLSGDPGQDYVADGMTEALISELARISSLRVISRTSVVQIAREGKTISEIREILDVDAIVEGSLIREGDRIRVTAQLIDARTDAHLWAERYDRQVAGVLALQSELAGTVAERISIELTPQEQQALAAAPLPVDPRAYGRVAPLDLVVRRNYARTFFYARQYERAIEELEAILEIDPKAVDLHLPLSYEKLGPPEKFHRAWMAFYSRVARFVPDVWGPLVEARARGYEEGGIQGARRAQLPIMLELAEQGRLSEFIVADTYADLGQLDEAFLWLERAWEQRDTALMSLKVGPTNDPFRSDPRYDDLVRRIGFP